jgi:hypothetical protein
MIDFDPPLSPAGEDRRRRILELAVTAARRRRLRRRAGRSLIVTAIAAVAFIGIWQHARRPISRPPIAERRAVGPTTRRVVVEADAPKIIVVSTDPTIFDRLRIDPATNRPRWRAIGDHELLADLAAAGTPAGMIRLKDRVLLIARR